MIELFVYVEDIFEVLVLSGSVHLPLHNPPVRYSRQSLSVSFLPRTSGGIPPDELMMFVCRDSSASCYVLCE